MNQATPTVASGSGGSTSGSTTRNRHPADQEQEQEEDEEERIMTPTQASLAVPSIAAMPVPVSIASASTSTSAAAGGTGKSRISRKKPLDLDISRSLGGLGVRKAPVHPLGDGDGGAGTRDELGEKLQGMRVGEVGNMMRTARPTTTTTTTTMMMTSRHSSSSLAVQDPLSSSTTATTTTRKKKPTSSHGPKERETPSSSSSQLTEAGPFGDLRNDEFKVLGDLGAGAGGTVDKVVHVPTGTVMAKKLVLIDAKPAVRKQILRELQIMHTCASPFIVSFYGAFMKEPHICICMEYMDRTSLDGVYKKHGAIGIQVVGKIAEAVLEGLTYLYDVHRIIHRDIKPSNILVNSRGAIKICDFGVSGELINSIANTFVGTSTYMSPERIQGGNYSVKSDVWSLGISLIELALGRFPFSNNDDHDPASNGSNGPGNGNGNGRSAEDDSDLPDELRATAKASRAPPVLPGAGAANSPPPVAAAGPNMSILDLLQYIVNEPAPRLTPPGKYPREAEVFVDDCLRKDPGLRKNPKQLLVTPEDLEVWAKGMA
ncbi:hypothetical protein QFC24_003545 [Naganishia onofrii]|uniref:Uncharacterized protein n=1 Tax=Naganishia onofrii TaxID=1851511 RepID=A0ACC2XJF0_9TREE|nr:hypothetical protein QFC24_003545 [Naganishia onofrii]